MMKLGRYEVLNVPYKLLLFFGQIHVCIQKVYKYSIFSAPDSAHSEDATVPTTEVIGCPDQHQCGMELIFYIFFHSFHNVNQVRLQKNVGYCFTPYQRLWHNGAPLVAFYDTLGIRRTYSRLKPRRPYGGTMSICLEEVALNYDQIWGVFIGHKGHFCFTVSLLVFNVICNDISVIYVTAQMCRRT